MSERRSVHDHFSSHAHLAEDDEPRIDLNVNFYPGESPGVAELALAYQAVLKAHSEELHPPIPGKWLHSTILRVSLAKYFTEDQIRSFITTLETRLDGFEMPELTVGHHPPEAKGDVIMRIEPGDAARALHMMVAEAADMEPNPDFIAHMSLAYSKARRDDGALAKNLADVPRKPATFRPVLWVVEQRVTNEYYVYHEPRIAKIPLGRAALRLAT